MTSLRILTAWQIRLSIAGSFDFNIGWWRRVKNRGVQLIIRHYTGCFTTCGHYCRRWFPRSLWSKIPYKHVSDIGRLRSYGHVLIPVHALVWTASYGTSWRVMYSAWWLIVCGSCNEQLAQFTTERQPVLRPAVVFSKTSFKHSSVQIKGNST